MAFELSGTLNTTSPRGAGCSRASWRPSSRRTRSTDSPKTVLSGRAKYTSSKTQRLTGWAGSGASCFTTPVLIRTNSPGRGSPMNVAPTKPADQVERAGFRRDDHAVAESSEDQRAEPARIDHCVKRATHGDDQAVRALDAVERFPDLALGIGGGGARDQVHDHFGIR